MCEIFWNEGNGNARAFGKRWQLVQARCKAKGAQNYATDPTIYSRQSKNLPVDLLTQRAWSQHLKAANAGNVEAQFVVGYYYANSAVDRRGRTVVTADRAAAQVWLTLAADAGDASAQAALSNFLSDGPTELRDYPHAIAWANRAIEQGETSSAHNLACIYRDMRKLQLAARWYAKAVEMGNVDSLLALGLCHLFGCGLPRDRAASVSCLDRLAADDMNSSTQSSNECARYWLAVVSLMFDDPSAAQRNNARRLLEGANVDDDHEQASELLCVIGFDGVTDAVNTSS